MLSISIDYTHYMGAIFRYYIHPFFNKEDEDRKLWIDIYRLLYFSTSAEETDRMLLNMFVYGLVKKETCLSRSASDVTFC